VNALEAGAETASLICFCGTGARREAEENGVNPEDQPCAGWLLALGEIIIADRVLMFRRLDQASDPAPPPN
jgi:hypothetical protein